jgi:hypothetical protein
VLARVAKHYYRPLSAIRVVIHEDSDEPGAILSAVSFASFAQFPCHNILRTIYRAGRFVYCSNIHRLVAKVDRYESGSDTAFNDQSVLYWLHVSALVRCVAASCNDNTVVAAFGRRSSSCQSLDILAVCVI